MGGGQPPQVMPVVADSECQARGYGGGATRGGSRWRRTSGSPPGLDTRERLGVASSYYRVGFTPAGR